MTTPSTVLVTGASGMLGSHIVDGLVKRGFRVLAVDLGQPTSSYGWTAEEQSVQYVEGDITDRSLVDQLVGEAHVVVHVAAILAKAQGDLPDPILNVNVVGTHQILEAAARRGTKVVFASSGSIYGPNRPAVDGAPAPSFVEGDVSDDLGFYALSKKINELHADTFARTWELPWVAMRCGAMFGPRLRMGLTTRWLLSFSNQLDAGQAPTCDGDPDGGLDWVFVEDAAECFVRAATQETPNGPINVSTGKVTRLEDALRALLRASGASEDIVWTGPKQPTGMFSSARYYSSAKCGDVLGFRCNPDISIGMAAFTSWRNRRLGA